MLAATLSVISLAAMARTADIGNGDTRAMLDAGPAAPALVTLSGKRSSQNWKNDAPAALIATTVATDKTDAQPLRWHFNDKLSRITARSASFVYDNANPPLRLYWTWQAREEHGPLEHTIRIENRGDADVWIPLQDSLRFAFGLAPGEPLEQLWIDKGAGEPPPVGTHRAAVTDGYVWRGVSSTFAHPRGDEPREIIPYFLVRGAGAKASGGWYAGVEFSGRVALTLARRGDELSGSIGLNPEPGPFRTRIAAHAAFATPTVFVGACDGDVDDCGNVLRRWVRSALNDPKTLADPRYPMLVNNSWGSAMAIDDAQARRMIDDAHALGFEMFHLDAGWFRAVGDWQPDPVKFPHGVAGIADYAHARGMKFGLWVDWAQAGASRAPGALNVADAATRDWLTADPPPGWKPAEFKGVTIDIGVPAAQAWASREARRIVADDHVDMLEHDGYVVAQTCEQDDHPHAPLDPRSATRYADDEFLWVYGDNSTDVSYHATRAYYAIQDDLKRAHPGLLLEVCNDGGRMVDFGSAAHGDYFSIVDSYDPLSNRQAFHDASHVLPPAMLETYVKAVPTPRIENFRYMLRSGMMGWLSVMIDTTAWSREQHDAARAELRLYKDVLRPLIRGADLYHVSARPDGKGWDGIEYFDPKHGRGALYAFHGSDAGPKAHTFALRGLEPGRRYRVRFHDRSATDFTRDGRELLRSGVEVPLPLPDSSEIVLIEAQGH